MAGDSAEIQAANQKLLRQAIKALGEVMEEIGVGGKKGLADIGVEIRNEVVQVLSTPGTGRTYRRGGVFHRASSPGSPPAVDTGHYRASWSWETGEDIQGPYVDIGTNEKTGPMLEFGTRDMAARPHVRVAVDRLRAKITPTVADSIVDAQRSRIARLPKVVR